MVELMIDAGRWNSAELGKTGIVVRAKRPDGRWDNADIVELEKSSLLEWLRSRGGENEWAEDVVGLLLGHGPLHAR